MNSTNNAETLNRYEGSETTELGESVTALLGRTAEKKAEKQAKADAVRAEIEAIRGE